MKKLLIGLLTFTSFSTFATELDLREVMSTKYKSDLQEVVDSMAFKENVRSTTGIYLIVQVGDFGICNTAYSYNGKIKELHIRSDDKDSKAHVLYLGERSDLQEEKMVITTACSRALQINPDVSSSADVKIALADGAGIIKGAVTESDPWAWKEGSLKLIVHEVKF